MDKPFVVQPVSNAEAETFWTDGANAIQSASGEEPGTLTSQFVPFDALHAEPCDPMPIDMLCRRCGERGGTWKRGRQVKLGQELKPFETNQRVALSADESGHYVYTHVCADSVGVDLPGVGHILPGESSPVKLRSGRDGVGDGLGRSPEPVADVHDHPTDVDLSSGTPVHELGLNDRLRGSVRLYPEPELADEFGTGDQINVVITPAGVLALKELAGLKEGEDVNDARVIARELLGALYTMIGIFGMPTKNTEAAAEVRQALESADAAGINEVRA